MCLWCEIIGTLNIRKQMNKKKTTVFLPDAENNSQWLGFWKLLIAAWSHRKLLLSGEGGRSSTHLWCDCRCAPFRFATCISVYVRMCISVQRWAILSVYSCLFYSPERVRAAELCTAAERASRGFHPGLPSSHEGGRGGKHLPNATCTHRAHNARPFSLRNG